MLKHLTKLQVTGEGIPQRALLLVKKRIDAVWQKLPILITCAEGKEVKGKCNSNYLLYKNLLLNPESYFNDEKDGIFERGNVSCPLIRAMQLYGLLCPSNKWGSSSEFEFQALSVFFLPPPFCSAL